MRQSTFKTSGQPCVVYEAFDEVLSIAYSPPRFCVHDGIELAYWSFFDSLNRFTLKYVCPKCGEKRAVSVKKESYDKHNLDRWTEMVKDRAGNQCEMKSALCSGELHAHHIIPKHLDPSKKYDVTNGLCLCEAHHKMIHSYM